MHCPLCGSENSPSAMRCSECDAPLPRIMTRSEVMAFSASKGREIEADIGADYSIEDDVKKDRIALYKAFIGPKSQSYYLRIFARFDREGKATPTWNPAALVMTLYWLFYRKMYRIAAIYFSFPWVVSFSVHALGQLFPSQVKVLGGLMLLLNLGIPFVVIPLYANAFYYWHCREHIKKIQASVAGGTEQCRVLAKEGGTSLRSVALLVVLMCLLAVLITQLMPRYSQGIMRSQQKPASVPIVIDK